MVNILSFQDFSKILGSYITMDTCKEKFGIVTFKYGQYFKFNLYSNDFLYFDTENTVLKIKSKTSLTPHSIVQIVQSNKDFLTVKKIQGTNTSKKYREVLYFPSTTTFKGYICDILIQKNEVTADDVKRADIIYGPSVPNIQGQMTRNIPPIHEIVGEPNSTHIPTPTLSRPRRINTGVGIDRLQIVFDVKF